MLPKQKRYHKPASQYQPRMDDVIPQEPGLPDTANIPVPCCHPLSPGSLFIWGHRNVNSLSLSISEKITVGPKLPHKEVAGQRRAEHNSKARGAWSFKSSPLTDDREIGVCPALDTVDRRHGFVRELYCCRMCGLVWQLWYVYRWTISNYSSETPRNASERSTFIHAAQNIDSVFYF